MNLKQMKKDELIALATYVDADFDEEQNKEMIIAAIEEAADQEDIEFALEDMATEAPVEDGPEPQPVEEDWEAENADIDDKIDEEDEVDISDLAPNVARRVLKERRAAEKKQQQPEVKLPRFDRKENDDRVLIRFTGRNARYLTHGVRFSRNQPSYPVEPGVADVLLEDTKLFRLATPKEVREFFS